MGDDLSTGAKIGIGLVILCFLIAIVLALLMVVKNITNSGANQMESGLNQMMQTTYDDYDQTIITGTKVKSAMKLFSGENIAIVINSKYDGEATKHIYCYGLLINVGTGNGQKTTKTNLNGDTGGAVYGDVYKYPDALDPTAETGFFNKDGVSVAGNIPTGKATFNLNTRPVDASGFDSYVRDSAKYQSFLIKDSTDTIIGMYFELS